MKLIQTSPIKVRKGEELIFVEADFDADNFILTRTGVLKGYVNTDENLTGTLTVTVSDDEGNMTTHRTDYYTR